MSSERSASAITSEPKPGALAPTGVGRSMPATAGSASLALARAVADWDGVITGVPRVWDAAVGPIQSDREPIHKPVQAPAFDPAYEPWRNRARSPTPG